MNSQPQPSSDSQTRIRASAARELTSSAADSAMGASTPAGATGAQLQRSPPVPDEIRIGVARARASSRFNTARSAAPGLPSARRAIASRSEARLPLNAHAPLAGRRRSTPMKAGFDPQRVAPAHCS